MDCIIHGFATKKKKMTAASAVVAAEISSEVEVVEGEEED